MFYTIKLMNTTLATTQINIRTDDHTKRSIAIYARERGMSVSQFMLNATRGAMKRNTVTMEPLVPTPYLEKIMRQADADLAAGRNFSPPMDRNQAREHLLSLMK